MSYSFVCTQLERRQGLEGCSEGRRGVGHSDLSRLTTPYLEGAISLDGRTHSARIATSASHRFGSPSTLFGVPPSVTFKSALSCFSVCSVKSGVQNGVSLSCLACLPLRLWLRNSSPCLLSFLVLKAFDQSARSPDKIGPMND